MRLPSPSGSPRLASSRSRALSPRPLPRLPLAARAKGRAARVFLAGAAAALAAVALLLAFSTVGPGVDIRRVIDPRVEPSFLELRSGVL